MATPRTKTDRTKADIVGAPRDSGQTDDTPISKTRIAIGAAVVLMLAGAYWGPSEAGMLPALAEEDSLRRAIDCLGYWGPLAIIGLMTTPIVMSPIPSGPIAVVAGAAFGPAMGTVYTVIGAELGAIIAFWIARCLGFETVRRWSKAEPLLERLSQSRSQAWLMAMVFASRLGSGLN